MTSSQNSAALPLEEDPEFARRLEALAEIAVARAVNLKREQELIVSAPLEAAPLVRQIARFAYRRGACAVTALYEDPSLILEHLRGSEKASDCAPAWLYRGVGEALRSGAARLRVMGPYPDLLTGVPPERIARAHHALAGAQQGEVLPEANVNSSIVPFVTGSWASLVFPDASEEHARSLLWEAVFQGTKATEANPLQAWDQSVRVLNARRDALQGRGLRFLRFYDGRTDLQVELAKGHQWAGGSVIARNGIESLASIPAEEISATLHGKGTQGSVFFSRPLALGGVLLENLYVEFECGSITKLVASSGLEMFEKILQSDEMARHLGQVGLVPASSVIANTGIHFWNALFDRNAASHVAFGQPLPTRLHIDCMLGHATMQVDGIPFLGDLIPIMREGEFVI